MNPAHGLRDVRLGEISSAVQVRHIETPLSRATSFNLETPMIKATSVMSSQGFDAAPVQQGGRVVGIIDNAENKRGAVGDHIRSLWPGLLVTANTPVSVLLEFLQHEPLLLVMEHQEVTGLVTPADLNSAAARSHSYLQFAALEIALSNLLRQLHPDQRAQDSAVSCLSQTRRDTYERLKRQLIAKDQYLDTFACLSVDDLVRIAGNDSEFREVAQNAYGGSFSKHLAGKLQDARNDLMHASRTLSDVPALIKTRDRVRALTEAAEQRLEALSSVGLRYDESPVV